MGKKPQKIKASLAKHVRAFPEGQLAYAIGDIHGRADLLTKMLERIRADAAESPGLKPSVVFLGDYVDRGLESARTIDILASGQPESFTRYLLRGNHEQAMQAFLADPVAGRAWLAYGGTETLLSYKVRPVFVDGPDEALQVAADALRAAMPAGHHAFLDSLLPSASLGDYFFAHAGVDPERDEAGQTEQDLYWIRDRFLLSRKRWHKMVVHGHTPAQDAYIDERRIGVDTGAYATGRLTAVRLEANGIDFISV